MQADPSVLIHRSDAGLLFLTAHKIQHLHSVYYVTVFLMSYLQLILKMYCTVLYVAIKIRLLNLKTLTTFN